MLALILLACTASEPSNPCGATSSDGGSDTSGPDGGAQADGGTQADGGAQADGGSPDGGSEEERVAGDGDCWFEEGAPPEDSVLGEEYWAYPVYISGTDRRFQSIQDAIAGAEEGDTVVVKPGTYLGTVDLLGKGITLCSEQGPATTVLDARGEGPVVRMRNWEPEETLVQGFTMTGGVGEEGHGGAIFVEWGSPTIRHNLVIFNQSNIAAGIYVRNGGATIENNIVAWNGLDGGGGEFTCTACRGRIAYNTFYNDDPSSGSAGEYYWGAADFEGNILVVPDNQVSAIRWLEPREDVDWIGGPNLVWPVEDLLVDADDSEWPDLETWVWADPGYTVSQARPTEGWQLAPDSPARDCGPSYESDADGSPADVGAFGGPRGDWTL